MTLTRANVAPFYERPYRAKQSAGLDIFERPRPPVATKLAKEGRLITPDTRGQRPSKARRLIWVAAQQPAGVKALAVPTPAYLTEGTVAADPTRAHNALLPPSVPRPAPAAPVAIAYKNTFASRQDLVRPRLRRTEAVGPFRPQR